MEEDLEDEKTLDALLLSQAEAFRKFLKKFIREIKSPESAEIIRGYLERNRTDLVLEYINKHTNDFNEIMLAVFLVGANFETKNLARLMVDRTIGISFDITHYQTIAELARIQTQLINDFNKSTSGLFAEISRNIAGGGLSVTEVVKEIVDNYGLTPKQYISIQNYRKSLQDLSRSALSRTLRDHSFDSFVRSAIDNAKPFTEAEINKMVIAYRRRVIESRLKTIARTSSKTAFETGRSQAALQADSTLAPFGMQTVKEWRSRRDDKVRFTHTHASLDGQIRKEKDFFDSISGARLMFPSDSRAPRSETINCRCRLLRYLAPIDRIGG